MMDKKRTLVDLTLIICTYRRSESLNDTLLALHEQSIENFSWEIIVVDNADDTDTQQVVENHKKSLPVSVIIEEKAGQNSARNAAIPHINGDLVLFTDDDVLPCENWLSTMLHASKNYPDASVFGGRILPIWPTEDAPWQSTAWFASFVYADQDLGAKAIPYSEGCYPSSPNMAIRRAIFDEGIKFNSKIGPIGNRRISGSESEFLSRVLAKEKGLYIPESVVHHRITPNMLERGYLRKRSYAMGLGMSVWEDALPNENSLPRLFGVARYRIGRLIKSLLLTFFFQVTFQSRNLIEAECRTALELGFCIGKWRNLKQHLVD